MDERRVPVSAGQSWGLAAGFAALFLILGYRFAQIQNVWVDETTQLLGSRLPLDTLFGWLSGHGPKLGVPEDRMPPISYLIDSACWNTVCGSDLSFRLLHLAVATAAVVIVVRLAATRSGLASGIVAGALMTLTPSMAALGVEIRAYPIFLTVAAVELMLFWRLMEGPALTWRRLLPFWAVSLIAMYVHFYGLVMAGAYCAALLVVKARRRGDALLVIGVGVSLLVVAIGLVPFITGAQAISGVDPAGPMGPVRIATYLLKLVAGPETLLLTPLAALYFVGLFALIGLALWHVASRPGSLLARLDTPVAGVVAALVAGIVVTVAAGFVIKGFDPLKSSYSGWMWPAIVSVAASGCSTAAGRRIVQAGRAAALALVVALVGIAAVTAAHATWFVHGPGQALLAAAGTTSDSAIVYTTPAWGFGYFPVVYRLGSNFPQYARMTDGSIRRITRGGGLSPAAVDPSLLDRHRHLVVAAIDLQTYRDLRQQLQGRAREMPALSSPVPGRMMAAQSNVSGLYSARIARFDKDDR